MQRGGPLALAVGPQLCMYLSTEKVCRAGSGPEGKLIRLQDRISMQQESGLVLKTSLKVLNSY